MSFGLIMLFNEVIVYDKMQAANIRMDLYLLTS